MKKAIAILVSMLMVIAFGSAVLAQEKAPAEKKAAAPAAKKAEKKAAVKELWIRGGEVTAVDTTANTVTIKTKKGEVVVDVNDKTRIHYGKAKKTIADIKAGDKVTAGYTEADGKNVAKSIAIWHVKVVKKAAKKAKKTEQKPAETK